jgi:predicted small secreted protein
VSIPIYGRLADQRTLSLRAEQKPSFAIYERLSSRARQRCDRKEIKGSTPARELLQIRAVCSIGFDQWFLEVLMRNRKHGLASLLLVIMMLTGAGSILSACGTVAGAGQDVSTVGNAVTSGADQTRRATGLP